MDGFYGLEVHAGQPAVKPTIADGYIFRVLQIALPAGATEAITLRAHVGKSQDGGFALATLNPKLALYQSSLDSVFSAKQTPSFSADGTGSVHVSGFLQPSADADEEFFDSDEDDELEGSADYGSDIYFGDDEEDEEDPSDVAPPPAKQAKTGKANKGVKHQARKPSK